MADAEAADVEGAEQAQVEEEVAEEEEEVVEEEEGVGEEVEKSVMRSRRRRSGVACALGGCTNSAQPHPPVAVLRLPVP